MATELAKAYVQILPSFKGIKGRLKEGLGGETDKAGKSAGERGGKSLAGSLIKTIAAAGIGKAVSAALNIGGALQQSIGGVETLYGEASDAVLKNAAAAAQAGISMNSYNEQVVSFGAALKQSLGGDAVAAAEAANTAVLDMADNAAKMGTPLQTIQDTYQSLARGNYQMLDSLKIGYGGTKTEMERLLADAKELTGVEYDINKFSDVTAAIHAIQGELGLTGVAAAEASTTFSGSLGAMKAAGENFVANMTLGMDVKAPMQELMKSVQTFVFKNLIPLVGNIASGFTSALPEFIRTGGEMIKNLIDGLVQGFNPSYMILVVQNIVTALADLAFMLMEAAPGWMTSLFEGLQNALPMLLMQLPTLITELANGFLSNIAQFISVGTQLLVSLISDLPSIIQQIVAKLPVIIQGIIQGIMTNLPLIIDAGVQLFIALVENLPLIIVELVKAIPVIIKALIDGFKSAWPSFKKNVVQSITRLKEHAAKWKEVAAGWLSSLFTGIKNKYISIQTSIYNFGASLVTKIKSGLGSLLQKGKDWITGLWTGISEWVETLKTNVSSLGSSILTTITSGIGSLFSVGQNWLAGLWSGISNKVDWVKQQISNMGDSIIEAIKGVFGIASPSKVMRDQVGKWIPAGIAEGIMKNAGMVDSAVSGLLTNRSTSMDMTIRESARFGSRVRDGEASYMGEVIDLLYALTKKDTVLQFDNREVARSMRRLGVSFS